MTHRYPWYDSRWLIAYSETKEWIERHRPEKLRPFLDALSPLRTDPDFQVRQLSTVFDDGTLQRIRDTIKNLRPAQLDLQEARSFGRTVVQNHPYFNELQLGIVDLVSDATGEAVEPSYNFLGLYHRAGVCEVHMDAPWAKWTLDLCVDQSLPWPIRFSQVRPWPVDEDYGRGDWQEAILNGPEHRFTSFTLEPGSAVVFSGSSQWHYREPLPRGNGQKHFCDLLFLHFIPRGTRELISPANWPRILGVPELTAITDRHPE